MYGLVMQVSEGEVLNQGTIPTDLGLVNVNVINKDKNTFIKSS